MYLWNEIPSHSRTPENQDPTQQSLCSTSTSSISITKTRITKMYKYYSNTSYQLPLFNSIDAQNKFHSILPFFGIINMTISCGASIYRSYENGDISTIVFLIFIYCSTFLLYYLLGLYYKVSPFEKSKKFRLKVAICVLLGAMMLGFAFNFSSFLGPGASLSFLGIVIIGNVLLFHVCFVWDAERSCDVGSSFNERKWKKIHTTSYCRRGKNCLKKYRHFTVIVDNV